MHSVEILILLINEGANFHVNDEFPIKASIYHNKLKHAMLLLNNGVKIPTELDKIILQSIVKYSNIDMIQLLLDCGVDFNNDDFIKNTIFARDINIMLLLDNNVDIGANNNNALKIAVKLRNVSMINLLLNRGAELSNMIAHHANENATGRGKVDLIVS